MTKVIENLELLKKLAPYLENIETEYFLFIQKDEEPIISKCTYYDLSKRLEAGEILLKTPTLEEAIELLKNNLHFLSKNGHLNIAYAGSVWGVNYIKWLDENEYENKCSSQIGETLLQAIEKMLEYLIDNNLLGNK